jgi:hypothetical protein
MGVDGNIVIGYGFIIETGAPLNLDELAALLNEPENYLEYDELERFYMKGEPGNWNIYDDCYVDNTYCVCVVHKDTEYTKTGKGGFGFTLDKLPPITPEIQEEAIKVYEILCREYDVQQPMMCVYSFNT